MAFEARQAVAHLPNVVIQPIDLAVTSSIDALAARHVDRPLHLSINNAGIMAAPVAQRAGGGVRTELGAGDAPNRGSIQLE